MTCISLRFGFDLAKYVMQVYPFYTYPKLHSKPLVVGYEKEGKIPDTLVRFYTY
jgi:hypothetical protein